MQADEVERPGLNKPGVVDATAGSEALLKVVEGIKFIPIDDCVRDSKFAIDRTAVSNEDAVITPVDRKDVETQQRAKAVSHSMLFAGGG